MPDYDDNRLQTPAGEPVARQVTVGAAGVYETPEAGSRLATEALHGEILDVFGLLNGYAHIQCRRDQYVGWVKQEMLSEQVFEASHKIVSRLAHAYSEPDLKSSPSRVLSLGAHLAVSGREGEWLHADHAGWIHARQVAGIDAIEDDVADVAERFLHAPYLWGGRQSLGLDCTGLTQQAFEACGVLLPRDSDMQFAWCGEDIPDWRAPGMLKRGDLVFWKGHVGIMTDAETLLHANAWHMAVAREPLETAIERIANYYAEPIGARRINILKDRGEFPDWLSAKA